MTSKINLKAARQMIREGVKFYTPTGVPLRSFKHMFEAWAVYGHLYFRRPHSDRVWILRMDGTFVELT